MEVKKAIMKRVMKTLKALTILKILFIWMYLQKSEIYFNTLIDINHKKWNWQQLLSALFQSISLLLVKWTPLSR